ncbi:MAG: T9SS type A sorting domain-containing protein [Ferruginibacter sp.]
MKKFPVLAAIALFLLQLPVNSQSITPFTIWKQVTQRGDITFTGNSNLSCNGGATCTTAMAATSPTGNGSGNNYNNNGFTMVYNNIADASDPVTRFSRTNANLTLGSTGGCGVIYAELVWGGNISAGNANYAKRDSVYLRTPLGGYNGLKADIKTDAATPFNGYYCYKDITSLVRQAGPGTYWVANLVNDINATNLCGGWALVVIYSDPLLPLRNLTVFRGLSSISAGNPQNIPITGFFTPPSPAAVNLKLGVYSFEGDRGTLGDSLKFNGNPSFGFLSVTDSKNPADNAFNSTINNNTAELTRNPASPNTLGMDLDIFVPNNSGFNFLPNSASAATLRMTSSGDVYAPFMISTAIDVFEPDILLTKSFVNINGSNPANLGDTIEYTLKVVNRGTDPSDSVTVTDSLYGAMTYVPNSLQILTGPNSGLKTDAPGDDQAEYYAAGNYLKIRLGAGANASKGGKLGITAATDSITTFKFRVKITTDCQIFHCLDSIKNLAYATYYGQTSLAGRSTASSPTTLTPFGCQATGPTELQVNVPVCALPADTSVTRCAPYNLADLLPYRPGYNQFFNSSWGSVTQATSTGTYYAIRQLYAGCNDTIQINYNAPCILPIVLQQFDAVNKNGAVNLSWLTQTEIDNDHFAIERSPDGIHFETIATVKGAGTTSYSHSYTYADYSFPKLEKVYYRLKLVDRNGGYAYSYVRMVNISNTAATGLSVEKIVPNPVNTSAVAKLFAAAEMNSFIRLYAVTGKQLWYSEKHLQKGMNQLALDLGNFQPGMYLLEIMNAETGEKAVHRIMVER